MISHRCPVCSEPIQSADDLAGLTIRCPYCQKEGMRVPQIGAELAAAAPEEIPVRGKFAQPTRDCFICGQTTATRLWYLRVLSMSQRVGAVVTTRSWWVNLRCSCCDRCRRRIFHIKGWTLVLLLFLAALPLTACVFGYLPVSKHGKDDADFRPGKPKAVLAAVVFLFLPWVVAVGGVFYLLYVRRRKLYQVFHADARVILETHLGTHKWYDISFKESLSPRESFVDVT